MSSEAISAFDIFKIGIGPSSSHTLGPWRAALRLLDHLQNQQQVSKVTSIRVLLYGSLAKTGKGHGTATAVQMGLLGADPVVFPTEQIASQLQAIASQKTLLLGGYMKLILIHKRILNT